MVPGFRDFDVVFNAGDSGDRVFLGAVHIDTNIPDPPFVDVPATLTVFGVADVATDPEMVDFETRFVGYPHVIPLAVQNVGTGALTVYDVTSNDPNLFVDEPISTAREYIIEPGEQVTYNLRWLPPALAYLYEVQGQALLTLLARLTPAGGESIRRRVSSR